MKENIIGKGAVGLAIAYFGLKGMVSIPLVPCNYNLIFDDGERIWRVNVISCSYKTKYGIYTANIRHMVTNRTRVKTTEFDPSSCDFVFVVNDEMKMYCIPSEKIKSKRQISLKIYEEFQVKLT